MWKAFLGSGRRLYFDAIESVFGWGKGKGETVGTVIGAAGQPGDDDLDLRPSDAHAIGRHGRSLRIPQIGGCSTE